MITGIRAFMRNNVGQSNDFGSDTATKAVVGGATLVGAGIGAIIGSNRQAADVVTIEKVPYAETVTVQDGTRIQQGCYQYHYGYNAFEGEFEYHYGYDSSCRKTVPNYVQQPTGRTLYKDVKHHTLDFPRTMVQGMILGAGIGLAAGIAGSVAMRALAS
jgi:hypothetical protein